MRSALATRLSCFRRNKYPKETKLGKSVGEAYLSLDKSLFNVAVF